MAATRRTRETRRPTPVPLPRIPGCRARCTPSPPRSASRTPCCRAAACVIGLRRSRADRAPPRRACVISLSRGRSCSRHRRRCRELDGLLLRAAPCLAESREPRRLVAGSHRCSPRPGPGSGTARGGDGGCGGSLSRGLGLGKCLRLHGQLGGRTGVDWQSWGEARGGPGPSWKTHSERGARRSLLRAGVEVAGRVRVCVCEKRTSRLFRGTPPTTNPLPGPAFPWSLARMVEKKRR